MLGLVVSPMKSGYIKILTNMDSHRLRVSMLFGQWPFQEPKLGVPTIYKAYFSGLNFMGYTRKIWPEIWYVYVPPCIGSWKSPIDTFW